MPKTLRGSFEQALRPLPSVVKGVQACRLPGLKCLKRCAAASSRHSSHCPLACRLPGLKCLKRSAAASTRHSGHCPLLLGAVSVSVCLPVSVRLSACLSVCLPVFLSACLPVCLSVRLSLSLSMSVSVDQCRLSACLPAQACRLPGLKAQRFRHLRPGKRQA